MRRIRPISHEDRLSVVDHLDELRSRLIISALAFGVAWALTAWQNELVLDIMNAPLPNGPNGKQIEPITLGPAEAFYTTLTQAAYFALVISLPVILYQIYAFILPAFSPQERRIATPLLLMVPVLFILGVIFCYFVVLTPALQFLLNFNADQFNTQVRARDYYSFVTLLLLAMGLGFQIPVGVLAACKLGLTSAEKLRRNRRYAVVVIVDPRVTPAHARPAHPDPRVDPALRPLRAEHPACGSVRPPGAPDRRTSPLQRACS